MIRQRSTVAPDDLEIGAYFTILRSTRPRRAPSWWVSPEDEYLKGAVLRVSAINLPYLLVTAHHPTMNGESTIVVDVRKYVFLRLSDEYIQAVQQSGKQATQSSMDQDVPF